MKPQGARSISPEAQREKRTVGLMMRTQGYTSVEIGRAVGVHSRTGWKWLARAEAGGTDAVIDGKAQGYAVGEHRQLTQGQESHICSYITGRIPISWMPYALWARKAVRDLIQDITGVTMVIRTAGLYVSHWGYPPQCPLKRAYEQRPAEEQMRSEVSCREIQQRATKEEAEIFWGDETGVNLRSQQDSSCAPVGKTQAVALTAKRFDINMISVFSNLGELHFMLYRETFCADKCIEFFERLTRCSKKVVLLILDNLKVHHAKDVKKWVEDNKDKIALFFLPSYSPELNPDEYLDGDLKNRIAEKPQARIKETLESKVKSIMADLVKKACSHSVLLQAPEDPLRGLMFPVDLPD